jgi:hypothetical protein
MTQKICPNDGERYGGQKGIPGKPVAMKEEKMTGEEKLNNWHQYPPKNACWRAAPL